VNEDPINPVCFGVMCERHADCARYRAKDGVFHDIKRIGFCDDRRSLFVPLILIRGEANVTG
jgi:hypothetical protein